MRLKESRFTIKIPVYDSDIHVVVTSDVHKSYTKLCKKLNWLNLLEDIEESSQDSACFVYGDEEVGDYYIILPYDVDIFVLSHEILHATFIILDDHNILYDKKNHEAFTYLHGHIMETVYNKLKALK
jgi:hypothetical protein